MDQIRIYVKTLPVHLKSVIDILMLASHEEVQQFLPQSMESVNNVAQKCLQRAQETQDGFVNVMDMIAELQEACVATKGDNETRRKLAQISQDVAMEEKRVIEEEKERLNSLKKELQDSIQEAENHFSEAVTSIPSGGEIFGMAITEGIVNGISAVLSGVSNSYSQGAKPGETETNDKHQELDEPTRKAYKQVIKLEAIVNNLASTFIKVESLNEEEVQNCTIMIKYSEQVKQVLKHLDVIKPTEVKKEIRKLCDRALANCSQLSGIQKGISYPTEVEAKEIASSILKLQADTVRMTSNGKSLMDACPRQRPPMMKSWFHPDKGAVSRSINNAKMKAESSCSLLRNAQENYAKASEDLTSQSQNLSGILGEMAKLEVEKLDIEQILGILQRGLVALSSMRTQWGKMVYFFQTITNIIDCSINVSLKKIVDISETARKSTLAGYGVSDLKRDMLYQEAIQISELAGFVTLVAESYSEMSAQHIMPKLDGLPKLLSFDPQTDDTAIKRMQLKLHTECTDAQKLITDLIEKKKREYLSLADGRITAIQQQMKHANITITDADDFV